MTWKKCSIVITVRSDRRQPPLVNQPALLLSCIHVYSIGSSRFFSALFYSSHFTSLFQLPASSFHLPSSMFATRIQRKFDYSLAQRNRSSDRSFVLANRFNSLWAPAKATILHCTGSVRLLTLISRQISFNLLVFPSYISLSLPRFLVLSITFRAITLLILRAARHCSAIWREFATPLRDHPRFKLMIESRRRTEINK